MSKNEDSEDTELPLVQVNPILVDLTFLEDEGYFELSPEDLDYFD